MKDTKTAAVESSTHPPSLSFARIVDAFALPMLLGMSSTSVIDDKVSSYVNDAHPIYNILLTATIIIVTAVAAFALRIGMIRKL